MARRWRWSLLKKKKQKKRGGDERNRRVWKTVKRVEKVYLVCGRLAFCHFSFEFDSIFSRLGCSSLQNSNASNKFFDFQNFKTSKFFFYQKRFNFFFFPRRRHDRDNPTVNQRWSILVRVNFSELFPVRFQRW